jgi:hypothetical protein
MAVALPYLVTIPNGSFGMVTAGPDSFNTCSRERRDRLRSAWLRCGWDWPDHARLAAPHQPAFDLAAAAAVYLAYSEPSTGLLTHAHGIRFDAARFVGVVNLDGRVIDGAVFLPNQGTARTVGALSDLPDALLWASGSFSCPEEGP